MLLLLLLQLLLSLNVVLLRGFPSIAKTNTPENGVTVCDICSFKGSHDQGKTRTENCLHGSSAKSL